LFFGAFFNTRVLEEPQNWNFAEVIHDKGSQIPRIYEVALLFANPSLQRVAVIGDPEQGSPFGHRGCNSNIEVPSLWQQIRGISSQDPIFLEVQRRMPPSLYYEAAISAIQFRLLPFLPHEVAISTSGIVHNKIIHCK